MKSLMKLLSEDKRKKLAKKEKQLAKLCMEIYEEGYERFTPLHPFVLVRVLPKDHITTGGVYLPDTAQNKPVYEGIVIKTWMSYDEVKRVKHLDGMPGEGDYDEIIIYHECAVKPGDRIAFPHYEGLAFPYGDSQYYKLVREGNDQNKYPYCNVLGTLDYLGDKETMAVINREFQKIYSITTSGVSESRGASK